MRLEHWRKLLQGTATEMNRDGTDLPEWVGRSEESRDVIADGPLNRLTATLDGIDPPFMKGDVIPPLSHWLYFLPETRQSGIGADGHATRGGFLPLLPAYPRRMWAGSRLSFPGAIRVGDEIVRQSRIISVKRKEGTYGDLVFVTLRHEFGTPGGKPAIIDEHDIVYRRLDAPAVKPAIHKVEAGAWRRAIVPDAVLLFRYSALTFNGHRIHYDRDYAMRKEGYPGLVVHGPLIATLLVDLLRRHMPGAGLESFSFRARAPLFDGREMSVNATPPDFNGTIRLWAADAEGGLAMSAEAKIRKAATGGTG